MAGCADFGLRSFGHVLGIVLMNIVAVRTAEGSDIMRTVLPTGDFAFAMTIQTHIVFLSLRRIILGTQCNDVATFTFFSVDRTGAVTRLAGKFTMFGCRGPWIATDAMDVSTKTLVNLLMAFHACLVTDQLGFLGCVGRSG
jgi:hypothetical protein